MIDSSLSDRRMQCPAPRPLFVKHDVYSFVDNRKQRVKETFNQLSDAEAMDEAVTQKRKDDCSLKVPRLRVEDRYATTREIKVDVRNQAGRMVVDRSKPIMEDATEVTVHIPFDGDPVIFDVAPSASNSTRVIGEIVDQEVRFVVPLMRPDFWVWTRFTVSRPIDRTNRDRDARPGWNGVEIFEWVSEEAIASAHSNPVVLGISKRFEAVPGSRQCEILVKPGSTA
jgi:hypothetical protein